MVVLLSNPPTISILRNSFFIGHGLCLHDRRNGPKPGRLGKKGLMYCMFDGMRTIEGTRRTR